MKYTVEVTKYYTKWFKEGTDILHRENGPAGLHVNGGKDWYKNGKRHREDGPAFEYFNCKEWWFNGIKIPCFTQEEFLKKIKPQSSCDGKVVEIDGKKYKLTEM